MRLLLRLVVEDYVEECGTITEIYENTVIVKIISNSMCASCHAKGACSSMDSTNKEITVKTSDFFKYKIGENVKVYMARKLGFLAVLLGFFFPFLIMTSLIFIFKLSYPNTQDIFLAIIGLSSLVVYYFMIYLLRNRIEKDFVFKIKYTK